jgi:Fe-S cluster assembly protein SufD
MADLKLVRTPAEQGLSDAFAAARGSLPGAQAVSALREQAFQTFESQGLPHRRVEEWKYTDLRNLMREAKPLAPPPDAAAIDKAKSAGAFLEAASPRRIVIADGALVREASDLAGLEPGLQIGALAQALSAGDAAAMQRLTRPVLLSGDAAFALNTAMMSDGAAIQIAPGTVLTRPLHLVFVTTSATPVSVYSRVLVSLGNGAQAMLLENHESADGADSQVNHVLDVAIGDEARLDHVKVVREGSAALHVASLVAEMGARAQLHSLAFVTGGAVVRNQTALRLSGEGSHAAIRGASLLKDRQHVDNTLVVEHAVGHCESRELFKSVLDDASRAVFQGKIVVQPHAQKTDAKMAAHALLLSDDAEADAKPELEIFADDVVCGHGATAGALDDELLFYLKARGIPQKEAEALMIEAFVGETVDMIENEAVREALMQIARDWLRARA